MSEPMVSAGEAARRLGVAPATIQRWADRGMLQVERTAGGHRRIPVTELRRLIAASHGPASCAALSFWLEALLSGDAGKVKAALIAGRETAASWAETADAVAAALTELGRRWEAGTCTIFEEHTASEALRRAAASCAGEMRVRADAPCAVLLTCEGERHTLGLSLAELVFAEAGWRTVFVGEGPPAAELAALAARLKPDLIVCAASTGCAPAAVSAYQEALMRLSDQSGMFVMLAGSGAWQETRGVSRIVSFSDLHASLAG
jgi:MerR family transcriptional regulator, light-induced transcriptional regulator